MNPRVNNSRNSNRAVQVSEEWLKAGFGEAAISDNRHSYDFLDSVVIHMVFLVIYDSAYLSLWPPATCVYDQVFNQFPMRSYFRFVTLGYLSLIYLRIYKLFARLIQLHLVQHNYVHGSIRRHIVDK